MDGLGINRLEAENVVLKGMKWKEDNGKWHARMNGIECVFTKEEDIIFIITIYNN